MLLVLWKPVPSDGDSPHPVVGPGPWFLADWHCGQPGWAASNTACSLTKRWTFALSQAGPDWMTSPENTRSLPGGASVSGVDKESKSWRAAMSLSRALWEHRAGAATSVSSEGTVLGLRLRGGGGEGRWSGPGRGGSMNLGKGGPKVDGRKGIAQTRWRREARARLRGVYRMYQGSEGML